MLPLVSVTLLGASVSANMSNVVTPEGSGPPGPSVGHEFLVISTMDLVFDLQLLCANGTSGTRCSCNGPGDALALPAYHTSPLFFVPPQLPSLSLTSSFSYAAAANDTPKPCTTCPADLRRGLCVGCAPCVLLALACAARSMASEERPMEPICCDDAQPVARLGRADCNVLPIRVPSVPVGHF